MTSTEELDPFTAVVADQRQQVYRSLADAARVQLIVMPSGMPVWLVTGYADVRGALNDPRLMKSGSAMTSCMQQLVPELAPAMVSHMLCHDGPDHTRLRRMVGAAFTRHQIDALAPRVQQIADELLDAIDPDAIDPDAIDPDAIDRGTPEVDLVAVYAYPLPMTVICELLGVPEQDRDAIRGWTETITPAQFSEPGVFRLVRHRLRRLCAGADRGAASAPDR